MISVSLQFGALAAPLADQLVDQFPGASVQNLEVLRRIGAEFQPVADAATLLVVRSFITERGSDLCRRRIVATIARRVKETQYGIVRSDDRP